MPQLPRRSSRTGVSVKKKSSAIASGRQPVFAERRYDTLFLNNYATINILDSIEARAAAWATRSCSAALEYSMRVWVETDRLTSPGITPNDIINALQAQNIQAAGRPHRRAADD